MKTEWTLIRSQIFKSENGIIKEKICNMNTSNADWIDNAKKITAALGLLEALKEVMNLIDSGVLVRDTTNDHDFISFMKQASEIQDAMQNANKYIQKATQP